MAAKQLQTLERQPDTGTFEWSYWLDEDSPGLTWREAISRSRQVCMTCHFFRHYPGPNCIPQLACHLHQGLITHGDHLTHRGSSCPGAAVSVFPVLVIVHALAATVWTGGHLVLDHRQLPSS